MHGNGFKDLTGRKFSRWTVIRRAYTEKVKGKNIRWLCRCDCGTVRDVMGASLAHGDSHSCGCYQSEIRIRHGRCYTKLFKAWTSMVQRCTNPKYTYYSRYGGRGIKVCARWRSFENFLEDMGERPEGMTLERIDNDGPYSPENCRWATMKEQGQNRSTNRFLTFRGETRTIAEWSRRLDIKNPTINTRLRRGWSIEEALTLPARLDKPNRKRAN